MRQTDSTGGGGSNTPPPTVIAGIVARAGDLWALPPVCDTLYVSADGHRPATWTIRACDLADRQEGEPVTVAEDGGLVVDGRDVRACWSLRVGRLNGYASYRYVWDGRGRWHGVTVLSAPPLAEGAPWRWFVMLRAELLWHGWMQGRDALAVLRDTLGGLGNPETGAGLLAEVYGPEAWKVSRCDVCRDHGGYGWEIGDLGRFATRSPRWSRGIAQTGCDEPEAWETANDGWTYGNPDGTTFYVGRRSSETRFLRVYCKSTEARATGKASWLDPFWRAVLMDGCHGPLPKVWRAEVEFGGSWLKAHGMATADKLAGCERTLWTYYTEAVRHTNGTTRQLRHEPSSAVWSLLATLPPVQDVPAWIYQPRQEPSPSRDMAAMRKQAAGCAARIMEQLHAPATEAERAAAVDAILADLRERLMARPHSTTAQTDTRTPLLDPTARATRMARAPTTDEADPFQ